MSKTEKGAVQPQSVSDIIARMVDIRDERRRISERDKELVDQWRSNEMELMIRLEEQGMSKASAPAGTVSITKQILPQVTDWDEFYRYIIENESLYLLQRRPAAAAFRELNDAGVEIAGVVPYEQKSISLRKA